MSVHGSDSVADPSGGVKGGPRTGPPSRENGTHGCPGRTCRVRVPDSLFCCGAHWAALSHRTRAAIGRTARMSVLAVDRRLAIHQALGEWREQRREQVDESSVHGADQRK